MYYSQHAKVYTIVVFIANR